MHDVEAELSIVEARTIHSKRHPVWTSQLRRERMAASPKTTTRPFPEVRTSPCARPAADIGVVFGITSTAESASFMKAKLSGGPFSDR